MHTHLATFKAEYDPSLPGTEKDELCSQGARGDRQDEPVAAPPATDVSMQKLLIPEILRGSCWSNCTGVGWSTSLALHHSLPQTSQVMGAPLAGSDMRAYVMTGGGAYLSKKAFLRPKVRSRRIQMIFPLHGSERSGMVSVEAKKRKVSNWRFGVRAPRHHVGGGQEEKGEQLEVLSSELSGIVSLGAKKRKGSQGLECKCVHPVQGSIYGLYDEKEYVPALLSERMSERGKLHCQGARPKGNLPLMHAASGLRRLFFFFLCQGRRVNTCMMVLGGHLQTLGQLSVHPVQGRVDGLQEG
eukprot:1656-Pelagomonas_calceolata.AAC.3